MDTQKQEAQVCSICQSRMNLDAFGKPFCPTCSKNTQPKNLYEEAFFDLHEYKQ